MPDAAEFLRQVRDELKSLNSRITEHAFLFEAERGTLPADRIRLFVENQYYIVYHDSRSISLMASRASNETEVNYLKRLEQGDLQAFEELKKLGNEVGASLQEFPKLRIIPEAVSYTHFLAWLSLYANPGEQVFALIVNLPVWSNACARLGRALKKLGIRNTGFMDGFASLPAWIEDEGIVIVDRYLGSSSAKMRMIARLIQSYEESFWDAVYRGV